MAIAQKQYLKRAESKDTLKAFSLNRVAATINPDFSYDKVLAMAQVDPIANGAIQHFVDKCMEGDFAILKRDTLNYDNEFYNKLQVDFNFRTNVLRKIFLLGKIFNNVFVELVKNSDGSVKELNVLDSTNLEVITKPNGDLLRLKSVTPHPVTGVHATWEESEIVWFKFGDMTKGYAPVDLRALWETLLIKSYITQYISWLWKTGQYKLLYQFSAGTPTQDINDFLVYLRKAEGNYQSPLILKGELETKIVRDIKELDSIQNLLKYLDNQVLILLRIPPVDAGIPDASGRSNADAQSNNGLTHITSWKTVVEDIISNDLFPKMNKGNNIIRFAPNDRFAVKQMFEVLQIMQSIGMTQDAMKEYMLDNGFAFNTAEMFTPPMQAGVLPNNPRKLDMMPSRTGKGTSEGNKPADAPTTRPDQLKKV